MAEKVFVLLIEIGHRIDTDVWTQNVDAWWIDHSAEGKPTKVEEDELAITTITEYTEQADLAGCEANPQSWFYDSATGRLYVHTTNSDDPGSGDYLLQSYFYERIADKSPVIYDGKYFLPYLNARNLPSSVMAVSGYHEGIQKPSLGSIVLINNDGYFDARLSNYIYEAKRIILRYGDLGAAWGDLQIIINGWTGNIRWTDEEIEIETLDLRDATISR